MATRASWYGDEVKALVEAAGMEGLTAAVGHLRDVAAHLAPIETGALEESATVDVDPATLSAAVSFDGDNAVRQHEDLDYRHDPGRQAKFLEQPMHTEAPVMRDLIADPIREVLR